MKSYAYQLDDYVDKVLEDRYPSGRLVKLAVRRHVMDIERGAARGLKFDVNAAEKACQFFPLLKHSTSAFAGTPFHLRCFQVFIVANLFGWRQYDEDAAGDKWPRRFREALVTFGKGNGKTPLAAAIANKLIFADGEERAEGYCFATKRDQAKQLFDEACRQARSNPTLEKLTAQFKLNLDGPRDSFLRPMGSETRDDGIVPHFLAMDEIHRWADHHRETYSVLRASLGKRAQPMLFKISTAGDENSHILKEELQLATRVLEQVEMEPENWFGDEQFAYIASLDPDDDIFDEENWPKANPMLLEPHGPVQIKNLRAMAAKAEGDPAAEIDFRRLHCNQQVSSLNKPIRPDVWAKGNSRLPGNLDEYPCYGGFDLGRSRDFCGVSLVWEMPDDWYAVKAFGWTVEDRVESLRSAEFLNVLAQPNVFEHEGNQVDYRHVRQIIAELHNQYFVQAWAYDPAMAHETSLALFTENGIDCTEHAQNQRTYNEPLTKFLEAVEAGRVIHGGCPLLAWCAQNLVIRTNAEGLKMPSKDKSVNKIDPIVALVMAWHEMLFGEKTPTPQVF